MNIFETLDYEHQLIGKALQVAKTCARRMAVPGATAEPVGQELKGFCFGFVNQCHQVKEFNLFVRLLQKGRSYVIAPITSLHAEHGELARLIGLLEAAWTCAEKGEAGACARVSGYLSEYAALMQAHLVKEDRFYKLTSTALEAADQATLQTDFERLDRETLGAEGYGRYCQWAHQAADKPW